MRTLFATILACSLVFVVGGASALSITDAELASLNWSYTSDPLTDTAGTTTFDAYGMGSAISNGFLYVVVQTNFPSGGAMGHDSYTSMTHFSPGDLYLNVGGTFQNGGGSVYGLATTTHANVVQQAYAGSWPTVNAGSLYSDAVFADGTFEQYQQAITGEQPDDGDGNNRKNSYPTLLRSGNLVGGDISAVRYRANGPSDPWDWDIFYKISLSALGLVGGETIQSFWTMECGNDGVQHFTQNVVIPEPTTVALMAAGLAALAVRRRRTA